MNPRLANNFLAKQRNLCVVCTHISVLGNIVLFFALLMMPPSIQSWVSKPSQVLGSDRHEQLHLPVPHGAWAYIALMRGKLQDTKEQRLTMCFTPHFFPTELMPSTTQVIPVWLQPSPKVGFVNALSSLDPIAGMDPLVMRADTGFASTSQPSSCKTSSASSRKRMCGSCRAEIIGP